MNVQEYIDSGVLFDYCTGMLDRGRQAEVEKMCQLYPEVQQELVALREVIGAPTPTLAPEMRDSVWQMLENINKEQMGDLSDLPLINKYTDHTNWKRMVQPLLPTEVKNDREVKTLRHAGGVTQLLIISKTDVDEEVHEQERESFIILDGECDCYVGDEVIRLGPGGFIEIPLHVSHNVRIRSPYVVAVLQHVAL